MNKFKSFWKQNKLVAEEMDGAKKYHDMADKYEEMAEDEERHAEMLSEMGKTDIISKSLPYIVKDLIDEYASRISGDNQKKARVLVNTVLDNPQASRWFDDKYDGNEFDLRQEIESYLDSMKKSETFDKPEDAEKMEEYKETLRLKAQGREQGYGILEDKKNTLNYYIRNNESKEKIDALKEEILQLTSALKKSETWTCPSCGKDKPSSQKPGKDGWCQECLQKSMEKAEDLSLVSDSDLLFMIKRLHNVAQIERVQAEIRKRKVEGKWTLEKMGVEGAGPVPNSLLSAQDLETTKAESTAEAFTQIQAVILEGEDALKNGVGLTDEQKAELIIALDLLKKQRDMLKRLRIGKSSFKDRFLKAFEDLVPDTLMNLRRILPFSILAEQALLDAMGKSEQKYYIEDVMGNEKGIFSSENEARAVVHSLEQLYPENGPYIIWIKGYGNGGGGAVYVGKATVGEDSAKWDSVEVSLKQLASKGVNRIDAIAFVVGRYGVPKSEVINLIGSLGLDFVKGQVEQTGKKLEQLADKATDAEPEEVKTIVDNIKSVQIKRQQATLQERQKSMKGKSFKDILNKKSE